MKRLAFYSTVAHEHGLDGEEGTFAAYFFALYHCSPDDPAGINELRESLSRDFPEKVIPVGKRFVLQGEPAFIALTGYHHAMAQVENLSSEFRAYNADRVREITEIHRASQSLPVPVDLTEGQLADDKRLELLTCIALRNRQVELTDDQE